MTASKECPCTSDTVVFLHMAKVHHSVRFLNCAAQPSLNTLICVMECSAVLLRGFCPVCYLLAYCTCQLAHLAVFNSSFGLRVPASLNCMQNMKIMSVNLVKQFDNQHGVPSVTFLCPVRYPHCAQMEHSKQILSILFCSH